MTMSPFKLSNFLCFAFSHSLLLIDGQKITPVKSVPANKQLQNVPDLSLAKVVGMPDEPIRMFAASLDLSRLLPF